MKKLTFNLATAILLAGITITGCNSPEEKKEAAKGNLQEAKEDLKEAQQDANAAAQKAATAEEWKAFRAESEEKINNNQTRIDQLRVKMNKQGTTLDPLYEKRIETLTAKNKALRMKMEAYEKSQSDWESFKREFNHDMDELGQSLKDFTVDNK